jgi:hypothetical protein
MLLLDTPSGLSHFLSTFNAPFLHLHTLTSPPHGFTCWLLLSTPTTVYLLDALKLRSTLRGSRLLNERIMSNPHVLKVVTAAASASE